MGKKIQKETTRESSLETLTPFKRLIKSAETLSRLEDSSEIGAIFKHITCDKDSLLFDLAFIPFQYQDQPYTALKRKTQKVITKARELSGLLHEANLGQWYEPHPGMILTNLVNLSPEPTRVKEALRKQHMLWLSPMRPEVFLSALLECFSNALEQEPVRNEELIEKFSYGKHNLKEFTKRRVFHCIKSRWRPERGANKATALIVNLLLDLKGSDQVTANDITQMNRWERKKYGID